MRSAASGSMRLSWRRHSPASATKRSSRCSGRRRRTRSAEAILARNGVTLVDTGQALDWLAPDAAAVRAAGLAIARLASELAGGRRPSQPARARCRRCVPGAARRRSRIAASRTWWDAVRGGAAPAEFGWQTALVQSRAACRRMRSCAPSRAFASALGARYGLPSPPDVVHNGRTPLRSCPAPRCTISPSPPAGCGTKARTSPRSDRAAACLAVPFQAAGPLVGPNGAARGAGASPSARRDRRTDARRLPLGASGLRLGGPLRAVRPRGAGGGAGGLPARPRPISPPSASCGRARRCSSIPTTRRASPKRSSGLVGDAPVRLTRGDLARRRARPLHPSAGWRASMVATLCTACSTACRRREVAA